jgi:hypothetical protein
VVLNFGDCRHAGTFGPLHALREKAGQDSIYLGAIKKSGNLRSRVSGKMHETISKLFLKGIAASPVSHPFRHPVGS